MERTVLCSTAKIGRQCLLGVIRVVPRGNKASRHVRYASNSDRSRCVAANRRGVPGTDICTATSGVLTRSPRRQAEGTVPRSYRARPQLGPSRSESLPLRRSRPLLRELDARLANNLGVFFRVRRIKLHNLAGTQRLHRLQACFCNAARTLGTFITSLKPATILSMTSCGVPRGAP